MTDFAQRVRGDRLRLRKKSFSLRIRNNFEHKHIAFSQTGWFLIGINYLKTAVKAPSRVAFKSVLDGHHKRFDCCGHLLAGS